MNNDQYYDLDGNPASPPKFSVQIVQTITWNVEVEAASEVDAQAKLLKDGEASWGDPNCDWDWLFEQI